MGKKMSCISYLLTYAKTYTIMTNYLKELSKLHDKKTTQEKLGKIFDQILCQRMCIHFCMVIETQPVKIESMSIVDRLRMLEYWTLKVHEGNCEGINV